MPAKTRKMESMSTAALPEVQHTRAFINGEFVDAAAGETFTTYSPATGERITDVTRCGKEDVDRAVAAGRQAFDSGVWSKAAPGERKAALLRLADLVEDNLKELALLEVADAGKTLHDCLEEDIPGVAECFRWYAEAIDKVFGRISSTDDSALGLIIREPVGVVGAVLPWNFPLAMLAWKCAPALAAGNSIVVKPAEQTSLSALHFAALTREAGIPAGVFNVVPGPGSVVGKAIGLHTDVNVVAFTGSTQIGREFLRYSADSNLKQVGLELGGKSPQIVMPDVKNDLPAVAKDLAVAAFMNAGQNCTAGSRILVHSSLHDELLELLVEEATTEWKAADPFDPGTRMGSLIDANAKRKVLAHVARAEAEGAKVLCGARSGDNEEEHNYVSATVIGNVTPEMDIARTEVFGPVVCVIPFQTEDEAIQIANDTEYGLAATVWSNDVNTAIRLSRAVKAGTVAVNGYSEGDLSTPFGGHRESGFGGRDKGLEAFEQYTELKTIWLTLQ